jgi:copper chaperone
MSETLDYTVSGMSCAHCVKAVSNEVGGVAGVESVEIDFDTQAVLVRGESLDDAAIRAAIYDAGYEVA